MIFDISWNPGIARFNRLKPINFSVLFILYVVAANLFQILGIYTQYPGLDALWKAIILMVLLMYAWHKAPRPLVVRPGYWLMFALLSLHQILSPLITEDMPSGLGGITALVFPIISFFVFMILLNKLELDRPQLDRLFKLLIGFVVFACLLNMVNNIEQIMSLSADVKAYELAFSSFFDNRNTFGYYLFISSAAFIYLLSQKRYRKPGWLILFGFILFNLVLTLSRTSILATLVFLIVFTAVGFGLRPFLKVIAVLVFTLGALLAVPSVRDFVVSNVVREDSGLSGRDEVYRESVNIWLESSVFVGAGFNESQDKLESKTGYTSTHNTYLALLIRGGAVLFTLFVFAILFSVSKIRAVLMRERVVGGMLAGLLVAYLVYSMSESQILFFSSVPSFIASVTVIVLPLYLSNYYVNKSKKGGSYA